MDDAHTSIAKAIDQLEDIKSQGKKGRRVGRRRKSEERERVARRREGILSTKNN